MLSTEILKLFWFCCPINYLHIYVINRDTKIVLILFQIWSWLQGDVNVRTSRTLSVIFADAYISVWICYIRRRHNTTSFVRHAYKVYFGLGLGDQIKKWAPLIVCHNCEEMLRDWTKGKLRIYFSELPWPGENRRTTQLTAIFVLSIQRALARKTDTKSHILVSPQESDLSALWWAANPSF